ncbi:uncharacterized protein LOC134224999 [Armigeres subalbatus]|uniref:uncharacterized protein LOC134224999 n=1 Tax=Armigeres subalbatus TaxID=124917 RepID=UPI002ED33649
MWISYVLLSVFLTNFICRSAPAFFNDRLQPLMGSSLERTLDRDSDEVGSIEEHLGSQFDESVEQNSNESSLFNHRENEDTDEKLYDLLLKILKVLDDQAYRDAERNRRLEHLRNPSAVSLEHGDSSLGAINDSWMNANVEQ